MELYEPADKISAADCKVYKRRWWMLTLFVLIEVSNMMSMAEYVSIAEAVAKYYEATNTEISWSYLITILTYSVFIMPSSYVIHALGLRKSLLIAIIATSLGSWIKVIGISPDRFWIIILGQAMVSLVQVLIVPLPAQLAGTWFPANEVSTACSIGLFTTSSSMALGFLIPPFIIDATDTFSIEKGLFGMSVAYAIFPTILIIVTYFGFQERPPLPPTLARAQILNRTTQSQAFMKILKQIFTNPSCIYLMISYGISNGIFYSLNTLLNQIILNHYPDATTDVGIIGFLINFVGALGSIVVGMFLDKFNRYKAMSWIANIFHIISTVLFLFLLDQGMWVLYMLAIIYGFSYSGVLVMGIELGVELTYPAPESIVGVITTVLPISIGLTYLYSYAWSTFNEKIACAIFCCIQIFANIFLIFIKFNLKRQAALRGHVVFDKL